MGLAKVPIVKMILVAIVAELLEEYTLLVARVLEQLLQEAPFSRRLRVHILRGLTFASGRQMPDAFAD
ncbi:hypothetical protein HPP92_022259 [Vanilla planifolia]|uniref:Uncharacterized protein n=1 Tax=Vanilla planifolia TaxID=51239 RepID=A0A835UD14_VANPL|nr:hypothetical protein HPP92_022259 [Vanilla planifolia]